MTGFGRAEGSNQFANWIWECRSVNGKSLDSRLRTPGGWDRLEPKIREQIAGRFSRGNLQISLSLNLEQEGGGFAINSEALTFILDAISRMEHERELRPSGAAEILNIRGVLEQRDASLDEAQRQAIETALLESLNNALDALKDHRQQEGRALERLLSEHLDGIEQLASNIAQDPSTHPKSILNRLKDQVARLGDDSAVDDQRLAQEAAILATKADITEELGRLAAHVDAARKLLRETSPIGRKLEFLAQEFNRETNTICSKSPSISVTESALALKAIVDQLREQSLNVE